MCRQLFSKLQVTWLEASKFGQGRILSLHNINVIILFMFNSLNWRWLSVFLYKCEALKIRMWTNSQHLSISLLFFSSALNIGKVSWKIMNLHEMLVFAILTSIKKYFQEQNNFSNYDVPMMIFQCWEDYNFEALSTS